jgi:HTH-type transcriptional regulator, competence development regulator
MLASNIMSTFGETIKKARLEKKLSQRALAEKIGINFTYLSKIEVGELDPPAEDKIYLLAEFLDLAADDLFALAQKVPREIAALALRPEIPRLLRTIKNFSRNEIAEMIEQAEKQSEE